MWISVLIHFCVFILAAIALICFLLYRDSDKYLYNSKNIKKKAEEVDDLDKRIATIQELLEEKEEECAKLDISYAEHQVRVDKLLKDYNKAKVDLAVTQTQDTTLRESYEEKSKLLETNYNVKLLSLHKEFEERIKQLDSTYKSKEVELNSSFESKVAAVQEELTRVQNNLAEQKEILRIAIEQNRAEHSDEARHYLQIPQINQQEILELNNICNKIKNGLPLRKAIYDIYYKTPYSTLMGDLQVRGVTGIYKITDKTNGKMYIGQSVDIGERWKQHIKRGCGADDGTISGSKLYSAMMNSGIWNFKFEVLQPCTKEELNKLEKYWINYFNATEFGYNMKAGG